MNDMKLAISNIGWKSDFDLLVYEQMCQYDFSGLEIAPTRIISKAPYEHLKEALSFSQEMLKKYGFCIPSMQSIWFGRNERLFHSLEERHLLLEYTKKAIDYASIIGCDNLVFGCPRNRVISSADDYHEAVKFFKEIGEYAFSKHTCIGIEANPPIYNTNFINDTESAIKLIKDVNSRGFLLNLDVGTMVYNQESVDLLKGSVNLINHVHVSEPYLKPIEKREIHQQLSAILKNESYMGYISIEMGTQENMNVIMNTMKYVKEVFG